MDPNTQAPQNYQPQQNPDPSQLAQASYGNLGPQPAVGGTDPFANDSVYQQTAPQQFAPGIPPAAPPIPQQPYPPTPNGYAMPQAGFPGQQPGPAPAPVGKSNPNSTQNTLQIAEIRDGIVIMNDGSYRSVIMCRSINFDLMSPQERESVEFTYQGFLNSLYFPIQIFVRSQRVDLRPYIDRLDKIRSEQDNMLLAVLMEDYIGYISELSSQTNIMDKKFYVVIPYFPVADVTKAITQSKNFFSGLAGMFSTKQQHVTINEGELTKAKEELRNRVQSVLGGLQQAGVQGLPLDTQELIELYYDTYNPDTATRQQLKNFGDLSAPVVEKGQGMAPQPNLDRESF